MIVDESALFDDYEENDSVAEALLALEALGYSSRELAKVEKQLKAEKIKEVDENIKRGLQILVS